jgi:GNAT superfamily N-acetyltransferase
VEEHARPAEPTDLDRLAELAGSARTELEPTRGGSVWIRREARPEPVRDSIEAAIADPDQLVLVGQLDGTMVGYAIARLEPLRDGELLTVLDDLYVEPGARSVGLGELLMNHVVDWARSRGSFGIDSLALPGNRATKNFFESFGLVARAIVVHRDLRSEDVHEEPLDA